MKRLRYLTGTLCVLLMGVLPLQTIAADDFYLVEVLHTEEVTVVEGASGGFDAALYEQYTAVAKAKATEELTRILNKDGRELPGVPALREGSYVKSSKEVGENIERTYAVYAIVSVPVAEPRSADMAVSTQKAQKFLDDQLKAQLDLVRGEADQMLDTLKATGHPELNEQVTRARDALITCITAHPDSAPLHCETEYDTFDRIGGINAGMAGTAPTSQNIKETVEELSGTEAAVENPAVFAQLQNAGTALSDCIQKNPSTWNTDTGNPATNCLAQYAAYQSSLTAFRGYLDPDDPLALNCPENDILCSPINLLIGTDDPDRLEYIARLRSEGFPVLFNSLVVLFAEVAATFAMIGLIYGAFLYVTAHGDEEQLGKAKQFILYTLVGLVLIALAYVIILGIRDLLYAQPSF